MHHAVLSRSALFAGMSADEIAAVIDQLHGRTQSYRKGQYIFHVGETTDRLGIVLTGGVTIERDDAWGNKAILDHIVPGATFAEAYACVPDEPLLVSAVAAEATDVLLLPVASLLHGSSPNFSRQGQLLRNLLCLTARKNLTLTRRIFHTTPRSLRGKLLSYLSAQAMQHGASTFDIPFDRQQLADYLGVDRSALSAELGRMRREGLLDCRKNHFVLHLPDTE